ncbi:MAG: MAPEG family protein [Pseudomonadota bacterium]
MTDRQRVFWGMMVGLLWSLVLLIGAALFVAIPVFALLPTIMTAFLAPGLVLAMMLGRVAVQRFVEANSGQGLISEAGKVDRRVIQSTTEQLVLAAAIWPAAAVLLGPYGPGVIVGLGLGFALARLVYWVGCHRGPGLRALGFSATFTPTVLVAIWALVAILF